MSQIAILLMSILETIRVDHLTVYLVFVYENSTIDEVNSNSKVVRAKIGAKTVESKSISKNSIKTFLAKSQFFTQSFRLCFLISGAR